jgi:hypothetical protein
LNDTISTGSAAAHVVKLGIRTLSDAGLIQAPQTTELLAQLERREYRTVVSGLWHALAAVRLESGELPEDFAKHFVKSPAECAADNLKRFLLESIGINRESIGINRGSIGQSGDPIGGQPNRPNRAQSQSAQSGDTIPISGTCLDGAKVGYDKNEGVDIADAVWQQRCGPVGGTPPDAYGTGRAGRPFMCRSTCLATDIKGESFPRFYVGLEPPDPGLSPTPPSADAAH